MRTDEATLGEGTEAALFEVAGADGAALYVSEGGVWSMFAVNADHSLSIQLFTAPLALDSPEQMKLQELLALAFSRL